MNATMVASGTKAVLPVGSSIQDVPLGKIRESKTNPRRFFDETKLAELVNNIRQHGVLQPILLRPLPEGEAGTLSLSPERAAIVPLNLQSARASTLKRSR
jgi:hypothetical protein